MGINDFIIRLDEMTIEELKLESQHIQERIDILNQWIADIAANIKKVEAKQ